MDPTAYRRPLLACAGFLLVVVTLLLATVETPGLGLGHLYYLAIALAAIAGGPWAGVGSGCAAVILFDVAMVLNRALPSAPIPAQTAVRLGTFVAVGALVGFYARSNGRLVAELSRLAGRDQLTGLPNTRAFEAAIARRIDAGDPFALVIGDVDELRTLNLDDREAGDEVLRRLAGQLLATRGGDEDVARIGGDEFAVLASAATGRELALSLERQLGGITFGWSSYPHDADNALGLFRAADERLYARKLARGYRHGAVAV